MHNGVHGGDHRAPDPDVVRSILSGSYPADRDQGAVATAGPTSAGPGSSGPVAPVILASTLAGAPVVAPDDVTRSADIEGERLVSIEAALPDTIGRAEHSGDPFMLLLARPGGPATPGVAVPVAPAADVADLGAALSTALSPSHVLYSAGAAHLAVVLPGKSQRDAVALTCRAAEGGAPTFTWVACRYPKDAVDRAWTAATGCAPSRRDRSGRGRGNRRRALVARAQRVGGHRRCRRARRGPVADHRWQAGAGQLGHAPAGGWQFVVVGRRERGFGERIRHRWSLGRCRRDIGRVVVEPCAVGRGRWLDQHAHGHTRRGSDDGGHGRREHADRHRTRRGNRRRRNHPGPGVG